MNKNFIVYKSSAGSGKTYTLALSFVSLSLKGGEFGYESYYKRILAITFTNKAAAEMKERVLHYFYILSNKQDMEGILSWLIKDTGLDSETIFVRSKNIHTHILHHYSDLNILTLDKFAYRIVRTFASDLDLSHNFELEMDTYKIIQPVVALLLSKVSYSGGSLSDVLVDFTLSKADDGKSTNIERDLEDFASNLFKENTEEFLYKSLPIEECLKVRRVISKQQHESKIKINNLRDLACKYFETNNLSKEHFIRGSYYNYFTNNLASDDDKKWIPTESLINNVNNDIWCADGKKDDIKHKVLSCKKDLRVFFNDLLNLIVEYNSCKAIIRNIYSISLLNELMSQLQQFKTENNIEEISIFNKKIHNIVTKQPSSFIYERIGERYNHYLIDEFQDTSLLQWQNILPLISESLDYGKSFVVGDGKQSIYRWRGGEVEQFLKLPNIYKGEKLKYKDEWEKKLTYHYNASVLEFNYRSSSEIIEFNNIFFSKLKSLLSAEIEGIYNEHIQKTPIKKDIGYVHLELFDNKEEDFKQLILKKIHKEIIKLNSQNGYDFKDIAILCNSRKRVSLVADYLASVGISVISNEGLLLKNSNKIQLIISCLKYLKDTNDNIARLGIVTFLYRETLSNYSLHQLNLSVNSDENFKKILKKSGVYLDEKRILEEPLYEMCEKIIRIFHLEDDIYLQFFLDVILVFNQNKGSSLSLFIIWWEEQKDKQSIIIPEGTNSVQVMTIHKSKGLAFNIVMIPFNWEDSSNSNDIWVDASSFNESLSLVPIHSSKILDLSYFKDEYHKEKQFSLLDNMNKLYVAMTRPKHRLYIFSKSFPDNISKDFALKGNLNSFLYQFSDKYPITLGDPDAIYKSKEDKDNGFFVSSKKKLDWRDLISLKHSSEELWDVEDHNSKKDWGKLLHKTLSSIQYLSQKEEVVNDLYRKGKCTHEDYMRLKVVINELLEDPKIKIYFSEKWKVKNEKEILLDNGKTYIPDRLLFDKRTGDVILIDYKTGEEKDKHIKQICNYMNVLRDMGYSNIKPLLIYTSKKHKIKEV